MKNHRAGQRILVTGGSGFIGSAVSKALISNGFEVWILDLVEPTVKTSFLKADVCDLLALENAFAACKPDVVVHMAALVNARESVSKEREYARVNVGGTRNVANKCVKNKVKRLVLFSSCAVYGQPSRLPVVEDDALHPLNPYGLQKLEAERVAMQAAAKSSLELVVLRPANVYGPGQKKTGETGVIPAFMNASKTGARPVVYGDGLQTRDYVFVEDVALATLKSIECPTGTFNIGTGVPTTLNELLKVVQRQAGKDPGFQRKELATQEVHDIYLDPSRAREVMGWRTKTSLLQGIRATWAQA